MLHLIDSRAFVTRFLPTEGQRRSGFGRRFFRLARPPEHSHCATHFCGRL